jgi:hypothetical protein
MQEYLQRLHALFPSVSFAIIIFNWMKALEKITCSLNFACGS